MRQRHTPYEKETPMTTFKTVEWKIALNTAIVAARERGHPETVAQLQDLLKWLTSHSDDCERLGLVTTTEDDTDHAASHAENR